MATAAVAERRPATWRRLGERVREARLAAGLTQEAVAERIGRQQPHVALVERGVRRPAAEELSAWAQALGVSVGELLQLAGYVPEAGLVPEADTRSSRVRKFAAAPEWLQDVALDAIDSFLKRRPRDSGRDDRPEDGGSE